MTCNLLAQHGLPYTLTVPVGLIRAYNGVVVTHNDDQELHCELLLHRFLFCDSEFVVSWKYRSTQAAMRMKMGMAFGQDRRMCQKQVREI